MNCIYLFDCYVLRAFLSNPSSSVDARPLSIHPSPVRIVFGPPLPGPGSCASRRVLNWKSASLWGNYWPHGCVVSTLPARSPPLLPPPPPPPRYDFSVFFSLSFLTLETQEARVYACNADNHAPLSCLFCQTKVSVKPAVSSANVETKRRPGTHQPPPTLVCLGAI
jgi:hypothetical protein